MKYVPQVVTRTVARTIVTAQKNSPSILFGVGVVGVGVSTVLACKATLKVEEILVEHEKTSIDIKTMEHENYSEEDRKRDLFVLYTQTTVALVRLYGPSVVIGAASIASLTKSHNILARRNAALTTAYAALDQAFRGYRRRVIEDQGEDKDREYRFGVTERTLVEDTKQGPKKVQVKSYGSESMYSKIYSKHSSRHWTDDPDYNMLQLNGWERHLTDKLRARGHLFLNEVFDEIGLERTTEGQLVGWTFPNPDGDEFVDFGLKDEGKKIQIADFMIGREQELLLDFNVDPGTLHDKINTITFGRRR